MMNSSTEESVNSDENPTRILPNQVEKQTSPQPNDHNNDTISQPDSDSSIFHIESLYHSVSNIECEKERLPPKRTIYLDYPVVCSFKSLVGVPQEIKNMESSQEDFLQTCIKNEAKLEQIGLQNNHENEAELAAKISELHQYLIPKAQKELQDIINRKNIWEAQTQNVLKKAENMSAQPILLDLSKISLLEVDKGLPAAQLNSICQHYDDNSFDLSAASELLSSLEP